MCPSVKSHPDQLHTCHPAHTTHDSLWPALVIHITAPSFSAGHLLPPVQTSSCQTPGYQIKGGKKDPGYPHQHPIEGVQELLKDVGWDPSTVPETSHKHPGHLETSSSEEQPELKEYQQLQPVAVNPKSANEKHCPDLNKLDPTLPSTASLRGSHLPIDWDLATFVTKFLQNEVVLEQFLPIHYHCVQGQAAPMVYLCPKACSAKDYHGEKVPRSHDMALAHTWGHYHSGL